MSAKDSFQPFSGLQTHGLLFDKNSPSESHAPWLFLLEHDGRSGIKNRADDPTELNQLPLLEKALSPDLGELPIPGLGGANFLTLSLLPPPTPPNDEAAAIPKNYRFGYKLVLRPEQAARRWQLTTVRRTEGPSLAHWLNLENDTNQSLAQVILEQDDAGHHQVTWYLKNDGPLAFSWQAIQPTDPPAPMSWQIKVDDKEDESKNYLRLLAPDAQNPTWHITENKDQAESLANLEPAPVDATELILLFDREGQPINAALQLSVEVKKLDKKKAITIKDAIGMEVAHVWLLDEAVAVADAAGETERQHRGYLLQSTGANATFNLLTNDQKSTVFVASLVSPEGTTGLLTGELAENEAGYLLQKANFWFQTQKPWREQQRQIRGICFDQTGLLIGLAVAPESLKTKDSTVDASNYDLQPSTYISREAETGQADHPARILARVRKNQTRLEKRIERLLGTVEQPDSMTTGALPTIPNILLDQVQNLIWQEVQSYPKLVAGIENQTLFTSETIGAALRPQNISTETVEQTLQLLAAMGVVVPVWVNDGFFYRRVVSKDLVALDNGRAQ
ncbi:MAG: hypothetical protein HS114_00585 [Anaerolineales bacterium]|nr:hypothetical protein [Anaerolineales bacterium]